MCVEPQVPGRASHTPSSESLEGRAVGFTPAFPLGRKTPQRGLSPAWVTQLVRGRLRLPHLCSPLLLLLFLNSFRDVTHVLYSPSHNVYCSLGLQHIHREVQPWPWPPQNVLMARKDSSHPAAATWFSLPPAPSLKQNCLPACLCGLCHLAECVLSWNRTTRGLCVWSPSIGVMCARSVPLWHAWHPIPVHG